MSAAGLRIRRIVAQTDMRDASATSLEQELLLLGGAEGVSSIESLSGGVIAAVWLVGYTDGSRLVRRRSKAPARTRSGLKWKASKRYAPRAPSQCQRCNREQ